MKVAPKNGITTKYRQGYGQPVQSEEAAEQIPLEGANEVARLHDESDVDRIGDREQDCGDAGHGEEQAT